MGNTAIITLPAHRTADPVNHEASWLPFIPTPRRRVSPRAVADRRHRGHRLRLRLLRAADAAADRAAGAHRAAGRAAEQPARSTNGSASSSSSRPWPAASSACSAAISPISSAGGACSSGASCSTRFGAFAAGYSTSVQWLLFWRCCTFVGVCVEFVAAVAWLAELFPNPKQREAVIGYTQAFGSLGGVMATGAYYLVVTYGEHLPAVRGGHEAWRYTLMSGRHPGDSAHHHPAVPARVADLAGRRRRPARSSGRASASCSSRSSARRRS